MTEHGNEVNLRRLYTAPVLFLVCPGVQLLETNLVLNFNEIKFGELNVNIPGGKSSFEFTISIYNSNFKTRKNDDLNFN